jgi:hypothetical protein
MLALSAAAVATSFGGDALPFIPVRGVERGSAHFLRTARTWTRPIMVETCPSSLSLYKSLSVMLGKALLAGGGAPNRDSLHISGVSVRFHCTDG